VLSNLSNILPSLNDLFNPQKGVNCSGPCEFSKKFALFQ
jgi:hypothetical protein